ncbi:GNAT family N-acetyltransferase [Psychromicrobium lacuslunae]|uniref:ATP-grasp domain-containing protein n=1 Tax=Psychromicrobium lacuslunae TaxID=1618207 RepID=A0A0D4BXW0_9MICC|nr:GNAT family N-acetyltransferase [Psychromicrobium lacuslunae]AJT41153.1 hypothetical protein UM93_05820 [Psychromicrobium lacuslunae]
MKSVVLTGGRAPIAGELARHFGEAGYRVIAAESSTNLLAASPFVSASYRLPSPRWNPQAFAASIEEMILHFDAELVLPSCEEVFWLAEAAKGGALRRLRERLFAADISVLNQLHHKVRFIELIARLGFSAPQTIQIDSLAQFGQLSRGRLGSPVNSPAIVLKPAYSRFGAGTLIVPPGAQLPKLPTVTASRPWLVQEFLTGEEFCLSGVFRQGEPRALSVYLPRWRTGGSGAGRYFQPIPNSDRKYLQATALAKRLANELNYTGFLSLDLIDTASGPMAIECNPRPTSGLHLLEGNLADALLSDGPPLSASPRAKKLSLAATEQSLRKPSEWLKARSALRGTVPIHQQLRVAGSLLGSAFQHRFSPLEASTYDLQYDGPVPPLVQGTTEQPSTSAPGDRWRKQAFTALRDPRTGRSIGISNASTRLAEIRADGRFLPITLPEQQPSRSTERSTREQHQTYLLSPYGHYIGFAQDELAELHSPRLEALLRPLIRLLGRALQWGGIDQLLLVNNALISTNLHPPINSTELLRLTDHLRTEHPGLAIAWRSVHGRDNDFPEQLRNAGYRLIPARSVLFVPTINREFARRRDYRRDELLFSSSEYQVRAVTEPSKAESRRMIELYRMLYIEKYSSYSPQYTEDFVARSALHGMLNYLVLEREGRIDGVIGYFIAEGYLAAPFLGYDLNKPQELGLYRMLNVLITETAWQHSVTVHASSGVPAFKRSRGAEPEIEFLAVYYRHLPYRQRLVWQLLDGIINSIAQPMIAKFEL